MSIVHKQIIQLHWPCGCASVRGEHKAVSLMRLMVDTACLLASTIQNAVGMKCRKFNMKLYISEWMDQWITVVLKYGLHNETRILQTNLHSNYLWVIYYK